MSGGYTAANSLMSGGYTAANSLFYGAQAIDEATNRSYTATLQAQQAAFQAYNAISAIQTSLNQKNKIPAFASGGYHDGGIRIVGENGPELEFTGPSMIYSNPDTMDLLSGLTPTLNMTPIFNIESGESDDSNEELVAELKAIRAELAEMKAINKQNMLQNTKTANKLQKFDTDGIPNERDAA
jgi:hypothetical protein